MGEREFAASDTAEELHVSNLHKYINAHKYFYGMGMGKFRAYFFFFFR